MTDERLAEIRAMNWPGMRTWEVVEELMAEVERLHAKEADDEAKALQFGSHYLADGAEIERLRDEAHQYDAMVKARDFWYAERNKAASEVTAMRPIVAAVAHLNEQADEYDYCPFCGAADWVEHSSECPILEARYYIADGLPPERENEA